MHWNYIKIMESKSFNTNLNLTFILKKNSPMMRLGFSDRGFEVPLRPLAVDILGLIA